MHACGAHLLGGDWEGLGQAGRDLAQADTRAGEMQDPDRLEVELVGAQVGFGYAQVV